MSEELKDQLDDVFKEDPVEDKKHSKKKEDAKLKVLEEENEKLLSEKSELNTKYLMALAEQKNYKKRLDDEMERFYKYANMDICKSLLNIIDGLDLATSKEVEDEKTKAYLEGIKLTRNQLKSLLEKEGVVEIEALGKEFDPNTMLAVSTVNMADKEDQEVVTVFIKGYMFKDRVLRAANVIVNQKEE